MASPWLLNANRIAALSAAPILSRVVLVLGEPSANDLGPLLSSSYLANSLVILAVNTPPPIPPTAIPAVRVLLFAAPFTLPVNLVPILERAERVARIWRKNPVMGIFDLPEGDDGANLLPSAITHRHSHTPAASFENLNLRAQKRWSKTSIVSSKRVSLFGNSLPPPDPSQRPFDDLFNFLPATIPEKILLKQTILITTIAHPFLCALSDSGHKSVLPHTKSAADSLASGGPSKNRWAAFTRPFRTKPAIQDSPPPVIATTSVDQPSPGRAHLVHLLPYTPSITYPSSAGRSRLVNSLESFLQSFSYSSQLSITALSHSRNAIQFPTDRAACYTLPASSLSQKVQCGPNPNDSRPNSASSTGSTTISVSPDNNNNFRLTNDVPPPPSECTLIDLILRGILDPASDSSAKQRQKQKAIDAFNPPRVWINGANDFIVLGSHWSSGTAANLTKLSLAARPGLGGASGHGDSRGPRARVVTGRVPLRPAPGSGSLGMRSVSTPDVEAVVKAASVANGSPPPTLTRADTDMIVIALKKHSPSNNNNKVSVGRKPVPAYTGEPQQNARDVTALSKLRQVYVPEESDEEDGGFATPADSETSEESSGVVTAPTSISNHGMDDDGDASDDVKRTLKQPSGATATQMMNENGVDKSMQGPLKQTLIAKGRWKSWKVGGKSVESLRTAI